MITLLGLLDLSAAFDTVDHQILFDRLLYEYGLDGLVLGWFKSYLTDRSICVHYNGLTSETIPILYGVPQVISPWSSNFHPLRGGCHQHSEGAWVQCTLVCRRSANLRFTRNNPHAPVWWSGCQPASSKSTNGWPATV